jgi:hypothetical protein
MTEHAGRARRERVREAAKARRDAGIERTRARHKSALARRRHDREIALVDLIDRLLDGGVVIHGDITLAVADVDLLYVGLRALVASVETIQEKTGVPLTAHSPSLDHSAL